MVLLPLEFTTEAQRIGDVLTIFLSASVMSEFPSWGASGSSHSPELKLGPDIEVAEAAIKVVEQVKRNTGCSKENSALSKENQVKLSIKDAYREESGR